MLSKWRRHLCLFALVIVVLAGPSLGLGDAKAQDQAQDQEGETPGELAREGMERLVRAIELMLEMIPQYEAPEVLPNGDIIIRRKNPSEDAEEPSDLDDDQART